MSTVLCIIDMQGHADTVYNWGQSFVAIVREINNAKEKQIPIILTEFLTNPEGVYPTHPSITNILGDYPVLKVEKNYADGSKEIIAALQAAKVDCNHILICGQVTRCCILETVRGLQKFPQITTTVIKDGCFPEIWEEDFLNYDPHCSLDFPIRAGGIKRNSCTTCRIR